MAVQPIAIRVHETKRLHTRKTAWIAGVHALQEALRGQNGRWG